MKLTSDNETLARGKVLILYILNKLNKPLNNNELFELILSIEDMNYFYYQQFLLDLLDNKYIEKFEEINIAEPIYNITALGKETLELTKDLIPGIIKLKIDNTIQGELQTIEEEVSIVSDFTPEDDGAFTVTCRVIENNKTIFEVSTYAASREQAKFISDNWKADAINMYPKFIDILTKK